MIDGPLYFGCVGGPGHFIHDGNLQTVYARGSGVEWMERLDGVLPPQGGHEIEGEALLHYIHGWTVIAFWDRSVDTRGQCNSAFFIPGVRSFDQALAVARLTFPSIFARFTFKVHLKGQRLSENLTRLTRGLVPVEAY